MGGGNLRDVRRALAVASVLLACEGEKVSTTPPGDTGSEAGSCDPVAGNLITNPSFESVVMDAMPGWTMNEGAKRVTGGAAHCSAWADVTMPAATSSSTTYFGQDFRFETPPPAGKQLLATLYLKSLDANIEIELSMGVSSGPNKVKVVRLSPEWQRFTHEFTATGTDSSYFIAVGNTLTMPRRIGVDQVAVVLTP
jgi:hypothetical protein